MRRVMRFLAGESGNVAIIFGIVAIPVFAMMGSAVDYNRASSSREKLNSALDSATLALGRERMMPNAQAIEFLEDYVAAQLAAVNYQGTWEIDPDSFSQTRQGIEVAASGLVPTSIMGVMGINEIDIAAATEVVREQKKLELALSLDSTGSMMGSRMSALRDAAKDLVDIINERDDAEENVKIAVVPFVTAVNIKSSGAYSASWIDENARARYHGANFDRTICRQSNCNGHDNNWVGKGGYPIVTNGKVNHLELFRNLGQVWAGCVEARPDDLAINDTPPSSGTPDTLFVPYFWPDSPDNGTQAPYKDDYQRSQHYSNNYLNDVISYNKSGENNVIRWQRYVGKYVARPNGSPPQGNTIKNDPSPWSEWTKGPNRSCARPILPLTDDMDEVKDEIDAMQAFHNSGTNVAEGLAWGWRVLSPGEPFSQGVAYDETDVLKALVLLTDGNNEVYGNANNSNPHKSHYGSYGYVYEGRLDNIKDRNQARTRWDQRTSTLCERVKAEGIRVYTITFAGNDSSTANIFRNCATEPRLFYDSPTNADLQQAFEDIAYDLSNLRISR